METVQRRGTKIIRQLKHIRCGDKLRELELFSPKKRRVWEDLFMAIQYQKGTCQKDGNRCFNKATGQGFQFKERRFGRRYEEEIFCDEGGETCTGCPRTDGYLIPGTFKVRLSGALSNLNSSLPCKGFEVNELSTQTILCFCYRMETRIKCFRVLHSIWSL